MLRHAGMTDAIHLQQMTVDIRVLRMNMENARAKLMDIGDRINELADQMTCVPLNAQVLVFRFVEQPFPHRWLREHVESHDRQMITRHRTMLESNAHSLVRGD